MAENPTLAEVTSVVDSVETSVAALSDAVSTHAAAIDAEQAEIASIIGELEANPDAAAVSGQVARLRAMSERIADAVSGLSTATADVSSTVTPDVAPSEGGVDSPVI